MTFGTTIDSTLFIIRQSLAQILYDVLLALVFSNMKAKLYDSIADEIMILVMHPA